MSPINIDLKMVFLTFSIVLLILFRLKLVLLESHCVVRLAPDSAYINFEGSKSCESKSFLLCVFRAECISPPKFYKFSSVLNNALVSTR